MGISIDMKSLIEDHQNSFCMQKTGMCGWNEKQEEELLKNYLDSYTINPEEINKILKNNLFTPLSTQTILEYFTLTKKRYSSDSEIKKEFITKLRQLSTTYSSNILTLNIFEYWRNKPDVIIEILGLNILKNQKISYEKSFEIDAKKEIDPHLDIYFEDMNVGVGIECKYTESFNKQYPISNWQGFRDYLNNDSIWTGLGKLRKYANNLYEGQRQNKFFNVKQSICHILGLHKYFNCDTEKYRFMYLYYASIFDKENSEYKKELDEFLDESSKDRIKFSYKTYNELIKSIIPKNDSDEHYIKYNMERYFSIKKYLNKFSGIPSNDT